MMGKLGSFIISAIISVMIVFALASCVRIAGPQQSSSFPPPAPIAKKENDIRTVTFENPRLKVELDEWWPTEVTGIVVVEYGSHKGDWIIEIRNVSNKPIKSVRLLLNPPFLCDAFVMGGASWIGLDRNDPYLTKPTNPTLEPGVTDKIVVESKRLNELIPPKDLEGCPPEKSYCFLRLERVEYADGTAWNSKKEPDDPNKKD